MAISALLKTGSKLERGKKMGIVLDEYDVVNVWLTMGQGIDTCEL